MNITCNHTFPLPFANVSESEGVGTFTAEGTD